MHEDITVRVEVEEALRNAHQEFTKARDNLRSPYEGVEQKIVERLLLPALPGKNISNKQRVSFEEAARKAFSITAALHGGAEICVDRRSLLFNT